MSKKRQAYTPTHINPEGVRIAFARELHGDVLPQVSEVIKFIANLHITGLDVLPKSQATEVTILQNETVRRYFMQRKNDKFVLDTDDLQDLAYRIHIKHGDDTPSLAVWDSTSPFSVDDNDTLVVDLTNSNELQIDRCRILSAISDTIGTRALTPEDIDALIDPTYPTLPIATVDKRLMGENYDDFVLDPMGYLLDKGLEHTDTDNNPLQQIPRILPLGKLSIHAVPQRKPSTPLPEYFPGADFDGVKKISYA